MSQVRVKLDLDTCDISQIVELLKSMTFDYSTNFIIATIKTDGDNDKLVITPHDDINYKSLELVMNYLKLLDCNFLAFECKNGKLTNIIPF